MEKRGPISRSCHTPSAIRHTPTARALLRCTILIVLAAGAAAAGEPSGSKGGEPEVVARVNGEAVTRPELQRLLDAPVPRGQLEQELGVRMVDSKAVERLALQKLIQRRLLLQEARRRNIRVTNQEYDEALSALRRRFKDLRSFGVWMKERGLDDKSLSETIRTDILMTRVRAALVEEVRLTDEQVKEYYEALKNDLKTAGKVRLRIIAVKDKGAAEQIMAALKIGADFSRLARERSLGRRAAQGGDTGWVNPRTLPSPLQEAVGTMKPGETAGPLQRGAEFLIVRLEGRRPVKTKSLAEVRPEIERLLLPAKQQEVYQAWLTGQEEKAKIEVFL